MKTFPEILIEGREAKGWTQQQVADQIPMERKTYSTYESGRSEPKLKILGKIVQILDIKDNLIDYLMEQNVPRETIVNSEQPDPSLEQVPLLLYEEIRELVKATQEIAKNTRREPPSGLGTVQDEIDMGNVPGKDKKYRR